MRAFRDSEIEEEPSGALRPAPGPRKAPSMPGWLVPAGAALVLGALLGRSCGDVATTVPTLPTSPALPTMPVAAAPASAALTEAEVKKIAAKAAADAVSADRRRRARAVCDDAGAAGLAKMAAGCPGYERGIPAADLPCLYRPEGCPGDAFPRIPCEGLSYLERVKRGCAE